MTSAQLKEWSIVAAIVGALCFAVVIYKDIEHKGALKALTAQNDSTIKVRQKSADSVGAVAAGAQQEAERAKVKALAQVAAGRAAQAKLDSTVRASANEREHARLLLVDSLASLQQLRDELGRLASQSRADSGAASQSAIQSQRTITGLLAALTADSVSLAAERAHGAALQALVDLKTRELALVRDQQPSAFKKIATIAGWSAGAFLVGRYVAK